MKYRKSLALAVALACVACGGSDDGASEPTKPDVKSFMTGYFTTFDDKVQADILELYATDVSAEVSGLPKMDNRDAVRDTWLVPFTTAFPDYSHTVDDIAVTEQRASVDLVFKGTHQAPLLGFQPTGKPLVLPIKGTYDVDAETQVVTYFKLEYDVATVFAAIQP